jgi:DNA-binding response OmpR family regulator
MCLHIVRPAHFLRALAEAERAFVQSAMLSTLAARRGRIVQYRELLEAVYGTASGPDRPLVGFRVTVCRLRRRGVPILAHRGRGYSLPPLVREAA